MILLICLWQQNILQTVLVLGVWTIMHAFFMFSLSHITVTGHMSGCCDQKGAKIVGPCRLRMVQSVRALLDFSHSTIITLWALYLLATQQDDVESHAFLYLISFGFYLYESYWNVKDVFAAESNHSHPHGGVGGNESSTLRLLQNVLSAIIVALGFRAVSKEMSSWRNSVVPLLMDLHPTSSWNSPSHTQRKALANHLLSKPSGICGLITMNLMVHEVPGLFKSMLKLYRISTFNNDRLKQRSWLPGSVGNNNDVAASLGAHAWRREHDAIKTDRGAIETMLSGVHRISFIFIRVVGGFLSLGTILTTESLVRDTPYVTVAMVYHGMAVYLLGGIITAAAAWTSNHDLRRSSSWRDGRR
nr:uncharacterized protein LOC100183793 [Ciona intestinalis]|eukprot:XP_002130642.3 uncharacterized protein LOC100183793 [Ciona intestinalis]